MTNKADLRAQVNKLIDLIANEQNGMARAVKELSYWGLLRDVHKANLLDAKNKLNALIEELTTPEEEEKPPFNVGDIIESAPLKKYILIGHIWKRGDYWMVRSSNSGLEYQLHPKHEWRKP